MIKVQMIEKIQETHKNYKLPKRNNNRNLIKKRSSQKAKNNRD